MSMTRKQTTALLLAAATATALLLGAGQAQSAHHDPVVLRIGVHTETLSAFQQRFEIAMRGAAAQQGAEFSDELRAQLEPFAPAFLEQRAQEFAWFMEAQRRGLVPSESDIDEQVARVRANFGDDDEAFEQALRGSGIADVDELRLLIRESEALDALYADVLDRQQLSDEAVRVAYLAQRDEFVSEAQVCARHILLDDEAAAEALLAEIEGGLAFADAADEHTTDPSGVGSGGDLGCFPRGVMIAPFENAVFGAEVGVAAGPVATPFGFHLVLVEERLEARPYPFAEVEEALRAEMRRAAAEAEMERLVDLSGAVTYPERLPVPTPPARTPDDAD